jgi:uncharacterized protein (DUF58 family)
VRIPRASIQTTWRTDWLVEFSVALVVLALVTREIMFATVGAAILSALISFGFIFHRGEGVLRRELQIRRRLLKTQVFVGDSVDGELSIRNASRTAVRILAIQPILEKTLSLSLLSSADLLLRPDTTSSLRFTIATKASGRFTIPRLVLTFTDARGLFTNQLEFAQADLVIEVYPGMRTHAPLTPLRLYGGGVDIFRTSSAGTEYAGIRKYVPGDEYHRVEWKATARLRTLMVKEFCLETQATLQILIDAGRTMRGQCYVGTKLDEALAASQLIVESAAGSAIRIGILVCDESRIMKVVKPERAEQQPVNLRQIALGLSTQQGPGEKPPTHAPVPFLNAEKGSPSLKALASLVRLLRLKLSSSYEKSGMYKALEQAMTANPDHVIILTDLLVSSEVLLGIASTWRERANIIVAQIGAPWRLSLSLEDAYVAHDRNNKILKQLQSAGLAVFDVPPEKLVDKMGTGLLMSRERAYA